MTLYLFNTTIMTDDADHSEYFKDRITLEKAKEILLSSTDKISAIGHESTAQIMSTLLDSDIPLNRINALLQAGDKALCFKLKGRPEEGKILSKEEVEKIGYEFILITRTK